MTGEEAGKRSSDQTIGPHIALLGSSYSHEYFHPPWSHIFSWKNIKSSFSRTWCCEVNGLQCSSYLSTFLNLPKSTYIHTISPLCGPLIGPTIVGSFSCAFEVGKGTSSHL